MDIQKELINGTLVEVLPDWHMPAYTLHALTSKREQYPMKVQRCIDALKQYFVQLPGGRSLQGVAWTDRNQKAMLSQAWLFYGLFTFFNVNSV